jgi:creatine kinase
MGCGASNNAAPPPLVDSPSKYVQDGESRLADSNELAASEPDAAMEPVAILDDPAPSAPDAEADDDDAMDGAARRIQAVQRGKAARKELEEQQVAATKMQAVQRGRKSRQEVQAIRATAAAVEPELELEPEPEPMPDEPEPAPDSFLEPEPELDGFPGDRCPETMPDLSAHHTLMAQVLRERPGLYEHYRDGVSAADVPFARCIKTGMDHKGHPRVKVVGLVAGDPDCYHAFSDLFNPVIEARHFGWRAQEQCHRTDLEPAGVLDRPIFHPRDPASDAPVYIRSVRLRSARSIAGFRFPPACSHSERREVERLSAKALQSLEGTLRGTYYPLPGSLSYPEMPEGTPQEDVDRLRASGYLFEPPTSSTVRSSGMDRDWPDARGVYCSDPPTDGSKEQSTLLVWVNEEDHLRLMALERGPDLRAAFERFSAAANGLEKALLQDGHCFARTDNLGYLLTCPSNLGTGLRVSVSVSLPGLSVLPRYKQASHALMLDSRPDRSRPGVFDLSNLERLGKTEVELVNTVILGVEALVSLEQRLNAGEAPDFIAEELVKIAMGVSVPSASSPEPPPPPPPAPEPEPEQLEASAAAAAVLDEPEPEPQPDLETNPHPEQAGVEQQGAGSVETLLISPVK